MTRVPTPEIARRQIVAGIISIAATTALPARIAAEAGLVATPRQTEGPFYPVEWTGDIDHDLVVVHGEAARALGQVTHVLGRVVDRSGAPIIGAKLEIWQCDSNGIYRHPADAGSARGRDRGFQGRGRAISAADGHYAFRTIRPVEYGGRTPHIHFAVAAPGRPRLITQMYVEGEPRNAHDFLLGRLRDPGQRASVIVRLEPADRLEQGALAGTFDIVLA